MNIIAISSHQDIKVLRKLHDTIKANVRGILALKVLAESYRSLLTSVLVYKLPSEIRLIVSRTMTADRWDLDQIMIIGEKSQCKATFYYGYYPTRDACKSIALANG